MINFILLVGYVLLGFAVAGSTGSFLLGLAAFLLALFAPIIWIFIDLFFNISEKFHT